MSPVFDLVCGSWTKKSWRIFRLESCSLQLGIRIYLDIKTCRLALLLLCYMKGYYFWIGSHTFSFRLWFKVWRCLFHSIELFLGCTGSGYCFQCGVGFYSSKSGHFSWPMVLCFSLSTLRIQNQSSNLIWIFSLAFICYRSFCLCAVFRRIFRKHFRQCSILRFFKTTNQEVTGNSRGQSLTSGATPFCIYNQGTIR